MRCKSNFCSCYQIWPTNKRCSCSFYPAIRFKAHSLWKGWPILSQITKVTLSHWHLHIIITHLTQITITYIKGKVPCMNFDACLGCLFIFWNMLQFMLLSVLKGVGSMLLQAEEVKSLFFDLLDCRDQYLNQHDSKQNLSIHEIRTVCLFLEVHVIMICSYVHYCSYIQFSRIAIIHICHPCGNSLVFYRFCSPCQILQILVSTCLNL